MDSVAARQAFYDGGLAQAIATVRDTCDTTKRGSVESRRLRRRRGSLLPAVPPPDAGRTDGAPDAVAAEAWAKAQRRIVAAMPTGIRPRLSGHQLIHRLIITRKLISMPTRAPITKRTAKPIQSKRREASPRAPAVRARSIEPTSRWRRSDVARARFYVTESRNVAEGTK
jgi:hypothetical protein